MHIPDGVLSPSTCLVGYAVMAPVWALAARRVRQQLTTRQSPLLAVGAAFCFTVMLFNIPALGGTTAHPVAGTLLAVLLGPWAACLGVSVALAIQALFFGDGGLLAFGANCFVMAFTLPFVGYSAYRVLAVRLAKSASARAVCAGLGAFVGLNAGAAMVALLLGVQRVWFHDGLGHALYFPFGLAVTFPAMLGTHLLVAGPVEAVVTVVVVRYLQSARIPLYGKEGKRGGTKRPERWRSEPLWVGLLALVALSPLGLLAKGEAWGEWDARSIRTQIQKAEKRDYVPQGIAEASAHGYKGVRGLTDYASDRGAKGYVSAGLLGVGAIAALLLAGGQRTLRRGEGKKERQQEETRDERQETREDAPDQEQDNSALPEWLTKSSDANAPTSPDSGPPVNRFVERTLAELATGTATALTGETWARQTGLLQSLDVRAKIIGFAVLIGAVAGLHRIESLLACYLFALGLARASGLPMRVVFGRVWLTVPLFVGIIALPAALNVVTPGRELIALWTAPHLALTDAGIALAARLLLRTGVSVTLALLLTLTTPPTALLSGIGGMGLGRGVVFLLAMTYRYVTVLLQTAIDRMMARTSRTVGRVSNREGRGFMGRSVGALWGKTLTLGDDVHAALLSRGFDGNLRSLNPPCWRAADVYWLVGILLFTGLLITLEWTRIPIGFIGPR